jgi:excisionase family DNA binding protein
VPLTIAPPLRKRGQQGHGPPSKRIDNIAKCSGQDEPKLRSATFHLYFILWLKSAYLSLYRAKALYVESPEYRHATHCVYAIVLRQRSNWGDTSLLRSSTKTLPEVGLYLTSVRYDSSVLPPQERSGLSTSTRRLLLLLLRTSRGASATGARAALYDSYGDNRTPPRDARGCRLPCAKPRSKGKMPHMERDDPRRAEPPANDPDELIGEEPGEQREESADITENSGYITTKQAAKALGVSRRTVQSYVRRGELEATIEGEGVEKTFYVSIDSLNALRERRRVSGEGSRGNAGVASSASAGSDVTTKTPKGSGATSPDLIEVVQDLQYRLGRAEAQVELTARTESTLREQLAREQERADRLEAELREARKPPPKPRDAPESASEPPSGAPTPPGAQEPLQRRSSWWRRFFGFE